MLTKVGEMQFAQISRNLVRQIAQNTTRYVCLVHTRPYSIECIVNLLPERDGARAVRARGINYSCSCWFVAASNFTFIHHCALRPHNNNNTNDKYNNNWHKDMALHSHLPAKSYANACVWHFGSNFIARPVAKLFRAWFLLPWRVMHFEFSPHTNTHTYTW